MKKIKFSIMLIAIITLLSTAVFAEIVITDGYGIDVPASVEYTEGSDITIDLKMISPGDCTCIYSQVRVKYDPAVYSLTVAGDGFIKDVPGSPDGLYTIFTKNGGTYSNGAVFATITATVLDASKVEASPIEIFGADFYGKDDYIFVDEETYKTITITKKAAGPKFDASGKATSGIVAGHDIVGGGRTEDRSYFADQFTLTGTTAETTILGIKTKFVPVYAAGADESKAVFKEYTINADEGIAGGAELKFNVVFIGAPAEVTGVNISSEILTK